MCSDLSGSESRPAFFEQLENIYDSYRWRVDIEVCNKCRQLYAHCYVEVFDDGWSFWCPIEASEIESLRKDPDCIEAMIESRPHIVSAPAWKQSGLYWNRGIEPALHYGPRG